MNLNYDEIVDYLDSMERDSKALKKHLFKLCWYMRGGISMNEMFENINNNTANNINNETSTTNNNTDIE